MGLNRQIARTASPWRVLLALVCVLLVVVAGTIQVAHTHADGAAAHVTVNLVQSPAPAPAATVIAVLHSLPLLVVPSALSTFALFTRPPPADAVSA
jgi:hypothetical protein